MANVSVSVKSVAHAKNIITGILAHLSVRIVSVLKLFLIIQ